MNPKLMHFFISSYVRGTESEMRKANVGSDWGKFLALYLLVDSPTKVIHRMKFEKFKGDKDLKPDEIAQLSDVLSIDLEKEFKGENEDGKLVTTIIAKVDVVNKYVLVTFNYADGTKRNVNI